MPGWLTKDVLLVSFSAFFADLGYQTAIAIFPIFLVVVLKAPASEYGIASAIAFGIGSFFGYLGGWASDRFNDKYVAILGNALIPLISLMGLATSPVTAVMLFSGGWWARNFRTPARRAILVEASSRADRGKAFGFLHMLDIGGGMLSVALLLLLVLSKVSYGEILLLTALPIIVSTLLLFFTKETQSVRASTVRFVRRAAAKMRIAGKTYKAIIAATALYGFSSYSLGFPILTIAQSSSSILGIASYGVYLGVSAFTGYYVGSRQKLNYVSALAIAGYVLSGLGTLLMGVGYLYGANVAVLYLAVAMLGFGLGVIETLEPTIISFIKSAKDLGKGMGSLAASRSFGIFFANLIMGILYVVNPFYSYLYAAAVSTAAGALVLFYGRGFAR